MAAGRRKKNQRGKKRRQNKSSQKSQVRRVVSIRPYRIRLNLGVFIFAVIFIYLVISVGLYVTRERISIYEVSVQGSLTTAQSYTGLILREETVEYTSNAGYVNYYIREGGHSGMGNVVYTLDESGTLSEQLFSESSQSLKDSDLSDLKAELTSYSMNYDPMRFDSVYNIKIDLDSEVLELANSSSIASLDQVIKAQTGGIFKTGTASRTGTISYYVDGYEGYTADMVTNADFENPYSKKSAKSGDLMEQGVPVYKTVTSDNWSLIFPMTEEDIAAYQTKTSMTIRVEKDGFEVSGAFSMFTNATGTYGQIDIRNYMIRYLSDRFLSFEIQDTVEKGLKIPKTALVSKNFYMIPKEYLVTAAGERRGFLVDGYNTEKQEQESTLVSPTIYSSDDTYYYVSTDAFEMGTYLNGEETSTRYQVGATASLQGVYSVNQGYTVFRLVEVITENDEYYIIKTDTNYGLSLYDHIILNSKTVQEGQVIYQ